VHDGVRDHTFRQQLSIAIGSAEHVDHIKENPKNTNAIKVEAIFQELLTIPIDVCSWGGDVSRFLGFGKRINLETYYRRVEPRVIEYKTVK